MQLASFDTNPRYDLTRRCIEGIFERRTTAGITRNPLCGTKAVSGATITGTQDRIRPTKFGNPNNSSRDHYNQHSRSQQQDTR